MAVFRVTRIVKRSIQVEAPTDAVAKAIGERLKSFEDWGDPEDDRVEGVRELAPGEVDDMEPVWGVTDLAEGEAQEVLGNHRAEFGRRG